MGFVEVLGICLHIEPQESRNFLWSGDISNSCKRASALLGLRRCNITSIDLHPRGVRKSSPDLHLVFCLYSAEESPNLEHMLVGLL
jgi:hypothetical protein